MRGFFFLPSLAIFMNQVCPKGKSSYARQLQYSTVGFQVSGTRPGAHRRRTLLGHFAIFPSVGVVSHVFSGDEPECCPLHQTMRPFLVAPLSKDCLWLGLAANSAASHTQPSSALGPIWVAQGHTPLLTFCRNLYYRTLVCLLTLVVAISQPFHEQQCRISNTPLCWHYLNYLGWVHSSSTG